MGEISKIQWCDSSWNPWYGCTHVSPGCDNCYMFAGMRRYGRDPEVVHQRKDSALESLFCQADARIPILLETPAAVRFVSAEPLLGPINLSWYLKTRYYQIDEPEIPPLDWVIAGGESGPQARACDLEWIRSIARQCRDAAARCFVKQLGGNLSDHDLSECARDSGHSMHDRKGGDPEEWTNDLRGVREFPA